jgi:hypothetical protein
MGLRRWGFRPRGTDGETSAPTSKTSSAAPTRSARCGLALTYTSRNNRDAIHADVPLPAGAVQVDDWDNGGVATSPAPNGLSNATTVKKTLSVHQRDPNTRTGDWNA